MIKILYLLRGLSGSGKSDLAEDLARGNNAVIVSLDAYRHDPEKGYSYEKEKIQDQIFRMDQDLESLMHKEQPMIILDNTHHAKEYIEKYTKLSDDYGYRFKILEIPHVDPKILAGRNLHGVPQERIEKMMLRWDYIGHQMPLRRFFYRLKKSIRSRFS